MAWTHYADLSGAGQIDFGGADSYGFYRAVVTDFGMAHEIEIGGVTRFMDLGWIAPLEDATDLGEGEPVGPSAFDKTWLEYEHQSIDYHTMCVNVGGFDGLAYSFRTDVVVQLYRYS